jgi:hypothetical protein
MHAGMENDYGFGQCFSVCTAAVAKKKPERVDGLMAYQMVITKASQKESWVIYDQNFRLDAANPAKAWLKVDPSTMQTLYSKTWCT